MKPVSVHNLFLNYCQHLLVNSMQAKVQTVCKWKGIGWLTVSKLAGVSTRLGDQGARTGAGAGAGGRGM